MLSFTDMDETLSGHHASSPHNGTTHRFPDKLKAAMSSASDYVKRAEVKEKGQQLDALVTQHPYVSLGIALGAGWLLGKLLRD